MIPVKWLVLIMCYKNSVIYDAGQYEYFLVSETSDVVINPAIK